MKKKDLNEAVAVTNTLLTALLATLGGQTGMDGAQLMFLCGQLAANAGDEIAAAAFGADFAACFEQARVAGATLAQFEAIRLLAMGQNPVGIPAIAVQNAGVRFVLVEEARILAATEFTSRDDIDNALAQVGAAFDAAELTAADSLDSGAYEAIIALHAAVNSDLVTRSLPLPRMVTYSYPLRKPALWLSQRIYGDGSRGDELVAENKTVHPAFMPPAGRCLSA
jgi:prophage DNA circulation protein